MDPAAPSPAPRPRDLFLEALEKTTPAERAAFLDGACRDNAALRDEAEKLLANHREDSFLESSALSVPVGMSAPSEQPGEKIGHYKLLQRIGEGGFGTVWMAEQEQPVRRRVALKIIKIGMDTKEVIARFEQERQALAMMDHPNIAKVFDGGATQSGRPFFVMELVRGVKITEYCDEHQLSTQARLGLFIRVCHAVQHAHQKGIIHRDLKPSNILVTINDGEEVPKVIDFGVAKATLGRLTDATLFTQFQHMVGTPLYMSPEQAELTSLDIDTRSDIYSLGVLLYELLTGRTPIDTATMASAGMDEIRRIIREVDPPRPSARVKTLDGHELTTTAKRRHTDAANLPAALQGDLDWIVMKCLEKDRKRRYDTANDLGLDLQRHLANEVVAARPPTAAYLFSKLIRRNKLAVAAGAAIAASLVIGLAASLWQAVRVDREAKRAKTAESHAVVVAQFMADMLAGVGPKVALGRDTKLLHEILDNTVERIGKDLKDQPEVEAELRATMAETYLQLGDVEKAESLQRQALHRRRSLFGETNISTAASETHLARVLVNRGSPADLIEAEKMAREALATRAKLLGDQHPETASTLYALASALQRQSKFAEAEDTHRRALTIRRKILGNHPETASSLNNLALVLRDRGKKSEAETAVREALAMQRKVLGNDHPDVALSLKNLAAILRDLAKLEDAEAVAREALALQKKVLPPDHPEIGAALERLANVLVLQNKATEAEPVYRELLATRKKLLGDDHTGIAALLNSLSIVLRKKDNIAGAEELDREALAMRRRLFGNEHIEVAHSLDALARTKIEQNNDSEAEGFYRESLAIRRKVQGNEHVGVATVLNWLSRVLQRQGKLVEGEATARESLAVRTKHLPPGHPDIGGAIETLAEVLRRQRKWTEAEGLVSEALANCRKLSGDADPQVPALLISLAHARHGQGKCSEAESLLGEALTLLKKLHGNTHREVSYALGTLAEVFAKHGKLREAEALRREVLVMEKALTGPDHPFVATWLIALGDVLRRQDKLAEAEAVFREALVIRKAKPTRWDAAIAQALDRLAGVLFDQGKLAEAEPLWREALPLRQKAAEPPEVASILLKLAALLERQQKFSEAEERCREALAIQRKVLEPEDVDMAHTLAQLTRVLLADQKFTAAEVSARESLGIREKKLSGDWKTFNSRSVLGATLLGQKKYADAEPFLLSGYEGMKAREGTIPAEGKIRQNEALERLVQLYEATAKPDKLAEWKRKLSDLEGAAK
jgi:eukaryotic-like serine/threonine-protein kinase